MMPDATSAITQQMEQLTKWLPLLIPVIILQFGLMIGAIISIVRKNEKELRFQNKIIWILIVIFVNLIGPIIYFIFGTDDKNRDNGGSDNDNYYNK